MESFKTIIEQYPPRREYLIQMLTDLQNCNPKKHLCPEALNAVVGYTKLSMAAVMGVVEYYSMFSVEPRGEFVVMICKSPICINKESEQIASVILSTYNIPIVGKSSPDGRLSVEYCECLGHCAEGTAVSINNFIINKPSATNIVSKIEEFIKSQPNA